MLLERIQQFQRQVLGFACNPEVTLPLTEEALQVALGDDNGAWFWGQLHKQKGVSKGEDKPLKAWLIQLINHIHKLENLEVNLGQTILEAFDHDITFHQHIDDDKYLFHYWMLDSTTQSFLQKLMEGFYTELLMTGFPPSIHGQNQRFDRDAFVAAFWQANSELKTCPACDGDKPPTIDTKVYADADHFLPKSKYPFLSLHIANLVPTCVYCNRSFKRDTEPITYIREVDPLGINDGLMLCSFFPYLRSAIGGVREIFDENGFPKREEPLTTPICLEISDRTDAIGMRSVTIIDTEGMPSERVKKLNNVWKLERRWPSMLSDEVDSIVQIIQEDGETKGSEGEKRAEIWDDEVLRADFKANIARKLKKRIEYVGKRRGYLLLCNYLLYLLFDEDEFENMFAHYKGKYVQAMQQTYS
jgi:hypothetical protein